MNAQLHPKKMRFVLDDGGRAAAGFTGRAGDCVARSIAIAAQLPYQQVYDALADINVRTPKSKRRRRARHLGERTASHGIIVQSKLFKDYMKGLGFVWVPTMKIGTGCRVHLVHGELPMGRLVVSVSKHYTAVIDRVIHDMHNPQREIHCVRPDDGGELKRGEWRNENGICSIQRRCVYGYWVKT